MIAEKGVPADHGCRVQSVTQEATPLDLGEGGHKLKPSDGQRPTVQRIHQDRQDRNVNSGFVPWRCFICLSEDHLLRKFPNKKCKICDSSANSSYYCPGRWTGNEGRWRGSKTSRKPQCCRFLEVKRP